MKLDDVAAGISAQRTQLTVDIVKTAAGKRPAAEGLAGDDRVELSDLAGAIRKSADTALSSRAPYVAHIAKAVASGRYSMDLAAIARGLMDEAAAPKEGV